MADRRIAAIVLTAAPLALTAACGSPAAETGIASAGGGTAAAAPSPSRSPDALKFAQCMRDHGIDVPDPEPGSGMINLRIKGKLDEAALKKAQDACKEYSPIGDGKKMADPKFQDALLKFAACMRDNGVNMPDPKVDGGKVMIGGPGMKADSPTTKKAMAACEKFLPGVAGKGAAGGSAGGRP